MSENHREKSKYMNKITSLELIHPLLNHTGIHMAYYLHLTMPFTIRQV